MADAGDLLRRALKNHDAIASALRMGISSKRLFRAIDDMKDVKQEAAALGCYPSPTSMLRGEQGAQSDAPASSESAPQSDEKET